MKRTILVLMAGCSLAGCATTSFAPPAVNLENEMSSVGSNSSFGQRCMPNERRRNDASVQITEDVRGARKLIDNFILMYRCRAHSAANGRQAFEVPAFLSLAGAAAATAFGGGSDWGIAGGVGNSLFASGGKYYAAQRKAEIYDHALDALLCIKTEAVGIDGFTTEAIDDVQEKGKETNEFIANAIGTGDENDPEVSVGASDQYFDMVMAALLSVERVAAQRLSTSGTPFDAAGVVAEIEALNEKKEEETEKGKPEAEEAADALTPPAEPVRDANEAPGAFSMRVRSYQARTEALAPLRSVSTAKLAETILKLRLLQPELQRCVVRAKV
ncbi:MAG TPA: hypothetical protein VIT45_03930 [Allosphingosinicella sp.]